MTPAAAGAHHVRGQRRMAPTTPRRPPPANAASMVRPSRGRPPSPPRLGHEPDIHRALARHRRQRQLCGALPTASAAPAAAPASTGRRRRRRSTAGGPGARPEPREHAGLEHRAGERERSLGAAERARALDLAVAEVVARRDRRRLDRTRARPEQEHAACAAAVAATMASGVLMRSRVILIA